MRGVLLAARGAALSRGKYGGNSTLPIEGGQIYVEIADAGKTESDFAASCP
jgi:hypothetical protein